MTNTFLQRSQGWEQIGMVAGRMVRIARLTAGLTLTELADRAGITPAELDAKETDPAFAPRLSEVCRLSHKAGREPRLHTLPHQHDQPWVTPRILADRNPATEPEIVATEERKRIEDTAAIQRRLVFPRTVIHYPHRDDRDPTYTEAHPTEPGVTSLVWAPPNLATRPNRSITGSILLGKRLDQCLTSEQFGALIGHTATNVQAFENDPTVEPSLAQTLEWLRVINIEFQPHFTTYAYDDPEDQTARMETRDPGSTQRAIDEHDARARAYWWQQNHQRINNETNP
jgi:transcriptional regulator with XRE-family HTH domain